MPLRAYVRPRLVILGPRASVTEAARAIEKNKIGAVVVQDAGRVVGIVTDRDLAVRVLAAGLDPDKTSLSDVMTSPVASLSPADSHTRSEERRVGKGCGPGVWRYCDKV